MKIEDAVAAMGSKTVYLSGMALNELALFGAEASVSNLAAVADAVKAKSPDARIVVLANTYRTRDFNDSRNKLNNAGISEYNNLLLDYCNENGFDFVDVATPLMENGCLADKFCSDNDKSNSNCLGCHLTTDAYAIWTAVLRDYARAKQAGVYVNPTRCRYTGRNDSAHCGERIHTGNEKQAFYIVMSAVLALCILGACITAPDDASSDASSAAESSRPAEKHRFRRRGRAVGGPRRLGRACGRVVRAAFRRKQRAAGGKQRAAG